jgi:hypothetical protein
MVENVAPRNLKGYPGSNGVNDINDTGPLMRSNDVTSIDPE